MRILNVEPDHNLDEPVATPTDQLRSRLLYGEQIAKLPPLTPVVDGWLDLDTLAVMYGRPGCGKSFLALDLACHVATGSWWQRQEVNAGPVLYVVAEGAQGMGVRFDAWRRLNRYSADVTTLAWLPGAVQFLEPEQVHALADVTGELTPRLVIIDTISRSMAGGDENAASDMTPVVLAADTIRAASGACVLLVHHSGKDTTAGARGHSSLLGAADTEIEVKNGGDGILTVTNTKAKNHAEADPLRLVLATAGDSVAVTTYTGQLVRAGELTKGQRTTLKALRSIELDGGVASTIWLAQTESEGVSRTQYFANRPNAHRSRSRPKRRVGRPTALHHL